MGKKKWTLKAYITHIAALRELEQRLHSERDRRYEERDIANKEALRVSRVTAEKLSEKIEQSLKEYKEGANEWRKTVSDLMSMLQGSRSGMRDLWGWIIAVIIAAGAIGVYLK